MTKGKVFLVGAGPGDERLVTLRAVEVLARADAVLYDYLVNPAVLRHCRPGAMLISLGQHGRGRVMTQEQINERMAVLVGQSTTVVRLKSGDPVVFGRAAEELQYLAQHGIPFEIIPGVTAGLAAASYAGIPITHRDAASAVALVTGQEDAEKPESALDFAALARFPGTLAIYMGVTTVGHWSAELMAAGKPAATPVAVLRHVSLPDQERISTTLGEVAAVAGQRKLRPPVVFLVGDVAAEGATRSWFESRPLFGQTILVTRPEDQTDELARPLAELGANVLSQPAIEIRPAADLAAIDRALARLDEFDWLVFSSSNGVRYFLERIFATGRDLRQVGGLKLAAMGPGTAEELERYHLRADAVPKEYRAESLAELLVETMKSGGSDSGVGNRFLLVRASRGREVLGERLKSAGATVEQVVVYESRDVTAPDAEVAKRMAAGQIHWTTVTSSAIARSLAGLFKEDLKRTKLASISPITSGTLRELGYEPAAEAAEYTMGGVVKAILKG